ncbi:hypothetical protein GCM10011587_17840 [Pyruvatibacter mobilis]|nr:hypothetical protein GCM10011587_17840 [Pyruvatibacter mobilis]
MIRVHAQLIEVKRVVEHTADRKAHRHVTGTGHHEGEAEPDMGTIGICGMGGMIRDRGVRAVAEQHSGAVFKIRKEPGLVHAGLADGVTVGERN